MLNAIHSRSYVEQTVDILLEQAIKWQYVGDYNKVYQIWLAIEAVEAIEMEGRTIRTFVNKGKALYNLHRYREALEVFNEVLQREPQNPDALFGKQQARLRLEREQARIYSDSAFYSLYQGRDWDDFRIDRLKDEDLSMGELNRLLEDFEVSFTHNPIYVVHAQERGTFFNSPAPSDMTGDVSMGIFNYWDKEGTVPNKVPYVKVGDVVSEGTILGRLATNCFNEIRSEYSGRIIRILVDNTEPVEPGRPLFIIKKD